MLLKGLQNYTNLQNHFLHMGLTKRVWRIFLFIHRYAVVFVVWIKIENTLIEQKYQNSEIDRVKCGGNAMTSSVFNLSRQPVLKLQQFGCTLLSQLLVPKLGQFLRTTKYVVKCVLCSNCE